MKSILSVLILSAAIAGPAAAQEVRISLADKGRAAVQAEIDRAAETVCYRSQRNGELRPQEIAWCIRELSDDALDQARGYEAKAALPTASMGELARNGLAEGGASK